MQTGDDKRTINYEWFNIKKLLWFPGMVADFIKYWKLYHFVTGKQYPGASTRGSG